MSAAGRQLPSWKQPAGLEKVSLNTEQIAPRFDPVETRPAEAARLTRMQWRMPIEPVRDLVAPKRVGQLGGVPAARCSAANPAFGIGPVPQLRLADVLRRDGSDNVVLRYEVLNR